MIDYLNPYKMYLNGYLAKPNEHNPEDSLAILEAIARNHEREVQALIMGDKDIPEAFFIHQSDVAKAYQTAIAALRKQILDASKTIDDGSSVAAGLLEED